MKKNVTSSSNLHKIRRFDSEDFTFSNDSTEEIRRPRLKLRKRESGGILLTARSRNAVSVMEFFDLSSEEKEEDDKVNEEDDSSDKENEEDDSSDQENEEDDSSDEESSTIDPPAPSHRRRISTPSQEKLKSVKRVLDMEKQRRRFSMVEGPGDVTPEVLSGIFDAMKREDVRKLKIRHRNSIPEHVIVSLVEDDPAFLDKLPVQKSNWSFEMKKRVAVEYYIHLNPDREPEDVFRMVNALNDVDLDNVLQSMINA